MFEHYLPNKNEGATVAPKSKFRELNKGFMLFDSEKGSPIWSADCWADKVSAFRRIIQLQNATELLIDKPRPQSETR